MGSLDLVVEHRYTYDMSDATVPVKRKPGRPRKNPVHEVVGVTGQELTAIHREAWEAFDYDAPRGKTDSLGRIWAFDPDIKGSEKIVDLSVRRIGQAAHHTRITVPTIGYQDARPVVEQIVNRLNEEVA